MSDANDVTGGVASASKGYSLGAVRCQPHPALRATPRASAARLADKCEARRREISGPQRDGLTPAALGILAAYLRREARRKTTTAVG